MDKSCILATNQANEFAYMRTIFYQSLIAFFATVVHADDRRAQLASEIELISVTSNLSQYEAKKNTGWTLYAPLAFKHSLTVQECNITAATMSIDANTETENPRLEIIFDLTRTRLPESDSQLEEEVMFAKGSGDSLSGTALILLQFLPPYRPIFWSNVKGVETETEVELTRFLMEPVSDEDHPRHLLDLLNQYQYEFCSYVG